MNKKHTMKKTAALLLALGLTFGAAGCNNFLVTDSMKDLQQVVAKVDITEVLAQDDNEYKDYADEVKALIDGKALSTDIPKRDLVAYFLGTGYTYIQSYGYTYEQTFTTLMDSLTSRKILTQYAVAYYIKNEPADSKTLSAFRTEALAVLDENDPDQKKEKELLQAYPEVLTMKYYLTDYGKTDAESIKPYYEAVYGLKKSLNDSLDSSETSLIQASDDAHTHEESRVTPTNANTEKSDYIPMNGDVLDYDVYTGRNALTDCGKYEKVDGSTSTTRKKAYNAFLSNLQGYGLIKEGENVANVTLLDYFYLELSSSLGQALVNKYYEDLQKAAIGSMKDTDVLAKYNELWQGQKALYTEDYAAFDTALDSVSDDSFLLYGLKDYGFVYNILLPFSAEQEQAYTAAKNKGLTTEGQYQARKALLTDIVAKDLRGAWICTDEHTNYSYEVQANATSDYYGAIAGAKNYLFFENNFKNTDRYETLTQYAGLYPYQGTVVEEKGEYKATPSATMKIDGFIEEMESYINFVVDGNAESGRAMGGKSPNYDTKYTNDKDEVEDYGKFIYYGGQVNLSNAKPADYFNKQSDAYKALSAVNELMFAYSTDMGCLNTYMGYAVSPYKTDFVSEFEYASQKVVENGVGTYAVVPSDYGWHIIYCSYKFSGGEVFGDEAVATDGYDHAQATGDNKVEGSFSNLFYESLKATSATNHANAVQSAVLNKYKDSVELYTKRYQDLLDLDA